MPETHPYKQTVLIVDDEPHILQALDFLLRKEGFNVLTAENGAQALEQVRTERPEIVVLDVMMPGPDGYEVARQIRQEKGLENVRIVFLTAKGTPADRRQGYQSGGEYYLLKPFENEDFIQIIREICTFG